MSGVSDMVVVRSDARMIAAATGARRAAGIIRGVNDTDARTAARNAAASPPLHVEYSDTAPSVLRFAFDDRRDAVRVRCARLAGPTAFEAWQVDARFRFLALKQIEHDADIESAAKRAYADLIARVRGSSHPYLLRIWNYLAAINAGDGDAERYRRFCVGRAAAVDAAFNDPPPAATAIGCDGEARDLQLIALCSSEPAIALENPRQTPAWNYPRDYGPVAPGFSRGALLDATGASPRLLASGTASIVGHVSQHVGDVAEQLRESLRNLGALLATGNERSGRRFAFAGCEALRIYLRHSHDLSVAQDIVAVSSLPSDRVLYLRGDVCRRELDVELEGVFAPD
jgi:chorismate lyase/3-hydroxybenzoate synthase